MTAKHQTGIQWTHIPGYRGETWNPTTGCTRVSPGCDHCYAETLHNQRFAHNVRVARRLGYLPKGTHYTEGLARIRAHNDPELLAPQYDRPFSVIQLLDDRRLMKPIRERKPRAYFVDSMTDLFHEEIPDAFLDRVFAVMACSPDHLFLILTKRPKRMREYLADGRRWSRWYAAAQELNLLPRGIALIYDRLPPAHLANVWLGVSVEDQERAAERVPDLLLTSAAVRFVSYEPALGPVSFARIETDVEDGAWVNALSGEWRQRVSGPDGSPAEIVRGGGPSLDWIIIGGESGKGARGFDLRWADSLISDGIRYRVPVFVKQIGARPYVSPDHDGGTGFEVRVKSSHGSNVEEWAKGLRVREWPHAVAAVEGVAGEA